MQGGYVELVINIIIITSTSDLQPSTSTAIVNQLPGQLISTQIDYSYKAKVF